MRGRGEVTLKVLRRRGSRIDPAVPGKQTALVASAARVTRADFAGNKRKNNGRQGWQDDIWRHYDISGEFAYGVSWVANSLSKVKLFIAEGDTDVPEPKRVEHGPAVEALDALFNGPGGQAELLRACGLHLSVPGELYLVSFKDTAGDAQWVTASQDELTRNSRNQLVLDRGDGKPIDMDEDKDFMLRIWRSHPRRWWLADSPGHHALPVLVELEALTKGVLATIDSRLAGPGILLMPNEFTFAMPEGADPDMEPLTAALIDAMVTPIKDRESAAAVVPFVIRGPAEHMDKPKLLQFAQNLDTQTTPLREAALKRLAISLDTPPEALLGFGSSNHWSAWQISEDAVKLNIEPLCATICDVLTTGYLWPLMDGGADSDHTIWFDTSALTQRPDRGPDAQAAFDVGELAAQAYRRYRGFSEDDAPSDAERRERLLVEILRTNPDLAGQILPLIGLAKPGEIEIAPAVPALPPVGEGDTGDGAGPPDTKPEDTAPEAAVVVGAGMLLACEFAVHRALEVGGKRLLDRNLRFKHQDTPPWLLHTLVPVARERCDELLADAWTMFSHSAPDFAHLQPALDAYVRELMVRGLEPNRDWLASVIGEAVSCEPASA